MTISLWARLAGLNGLSYVGGFLFVFVPGGLGVREYAMNQLLLPILPAGVAALISIAARLWNVAGELLGGAVVLALFRGATRRTESPSPASSTKTNPS